MQLRLPFWAVLFALVVSGIAFAQSPSTPPAPAPARAMEPGQIVAKKVVGSVSVKINGVISELHNDDPVSQSATVITANESSVILVFSNGATTQLGADTTLVIDEFMQDPFAATVAVANLQSEPTKSHTKLRLTKGELVGQVAKLHHDQGSYFTVETPVGAAGIRGTTFRIVFRPTGNGQAFVFALSTVEGNVAFHQGATGDQVARGQVPGPGGPPGPGGQTPGPGQGPTENGGGTTSGGSSTGGTPGGGSGSGPGGTTGGGSTPVSVTSGQEVVVTVTVNVNPQGQVIVTEPPKITSTVPISMDTQTQIVAQAQVIATTAATASFAPTPPPTTPPASNSSSSNSGDQQQGDSSGTSSGGTTSGTSSGGTTSTGGTGSGTPSTGGTTGDTTQKFTPTQPSTPTVTSPVPPLTNGAGK